jgi:phosphoenolpyruvate-protein kinase (PTS system EI component)
MLQRVIAIGTAVTLFVGLGVTGISQYRDHENRVQAAVEDAKAKQAHEDAEKQERARDRDHIRKLEHIITSEFPKWTDFIDWDNK